jgi:hypothetical protein
MPDAKTCFVISPIGSDVSDIRKRADQVLKYVIEPAAAVCGYVALRSDKISEPGNITSQVIAQVLDAPMLVADLTGSNGNVFYELALRHAVKKPFVQLIADGEKIPFDIAGMRTVYLNHRDLDSVQAAKEEIEKQIKAVEGKPPEQIESPITVALDFKAMRQSENPEQRSMAEVFAAINGLRAELGDMTKRISRPVNWDRMRELEALNIKLTKEKQELEGFIRDQDVAFHNRIHELVDQIPGTGTGTG